VTHKAVVEMGDNLFLERISKSRKWM